MSGEFDIEWQTNKGNFFAQNSLWDLTVRAALSSRGKATGSGGAPQEEQKFLIWIQERFAAEPPRNDSGADFQGNDSGFRPKVRVTDQKSELQTQKSELQWGRPPESEPNCPEKKPESGLGASTENPP